MAGNRVILHVDMDAFFASVEQRDCPEWRGKPVIVGGHPEQRGVVCAASYEARKFGVRSAMPMRTAVKLCPKAVFVSPRMAVYRAESEHLMRIFPRYAVQVEQISVDEAYLEVQQYEDDVEGVADPDVLLRKAAEVAKQIKMALREERNLTGSVGVATNKFLAKLGSDYQKPDGLTVVWEAGKVEFLRPLPVRCIYGVGPVTGAALEAVGLQTIGDLQDTTMRLEAVVGSWAGTLKAFAFGEDDRKLEVDGVRKSISAEHTFDRNTDDRRELRLALAEMATDVAKTLEEERMGALTVQVKVRYGNFETLTRQVRLEDPVNSAREIYRVSCHLLGVHKLVKEPLRLLGIGVSTLVPKEMQQLRFRF